MNNQLFFIIKIIFISTLLSFLIKYGGRLLPIEANNILALTVVLLPSFLLMLIFLLKDKTVNT